MRKVTFGGANSLDHFFARRNHEVDWLLWSDEASKIVQSFWTNVDTIIMDRKTYDIAMKNAQKVKTPQTRMVTLGHMFFRES